MIIEVVYTGDAIILSTETIDYYLSCDLAAELGEELCLAAEDWRSRI